MIRIAKIVATHGLQGSVLLQHFSLNANWVKEGDMLMVALRKDSRVPYFVSKIGHSNEKETLLQLDEVVTAELAKLLVGKEIFIDQKVNTIISEDTPLAWLNFKMIDLNSNAEGEIIDIYQSPGQWIAEVKIMEKNVLVPLSKELITEVNIAQSVIKINIPEGLIDIY